MRTTLWLSSVLVLCLAACGSDPTPVVTPPADVPATPTDTQTPPTDTQTPPADVPRDVRTDTGPADAGPPSTAGNACTADGTTCLDPLMCQDVGARGFCTTQCDDGTTSAEQGQCGGRGSTCLTQGDGTTARSFCTHACTPGARSEATGACRTGTVCTGWWYTHAAGADDPGCFPFCGANTDCGAATPTCNVRTGSCAATGVDMTRLADGRACNPMMTVMVPGDPAGSAPRNIQCRGICFGISSTNRTQGLCGSFLNLGAAESSGGCPDDPDQVQPRAGASAGEDNLGICIFRNCERDCDCGAGLVCTYPEQSGAPVTTADRLCQYPSTAQPTGVACAADAGTDAAPTDATPTDATPVTDAATDVTPATDTTPATDATAPTDAAVDAGAATDAAAATG